MLLTVMAVLVVLVAVDRVAEVVTSRRLAVGIQTAQDLQSRPRVRVHGFPFLTQVLAGRYRDVEVEADGPIVVRRVRIDDTTVRLHEVRVTIHDAVAGTVPNLPVKTGAGSAVVPYSALTTAVHRYGGTLGSNLQVVGAGPGLARLQGPFSLGVTAKARVSAGKLSIVPRPGDVASLPDPVRGLVEASLASPLPLPPFPFNVQLATGTFQPDGLHLSATSRNSVFPVRRP